ncbi:Protein maternal effect lethal 26 like protein [Argiope bruennichi]|uniref:Protein maternal effect lethal 26 like protein n=1 Tax=Argiope bruennichi TaxID=94029 RepID=A0A8T0ENI3_ARGBR|nr:Protein maternal effect lethal 26 like protein [Argiope bruennichi]
MFENSEADYKEEFHFRWQIKNFSFANCKTGEAIESPPFVVDILDETKWYILVYPNGKEDEEYVDIYLSRAIDDYGGDNIPIIFTFELEAADSTRLECRISPRSFFTRNLAWGFNPYIKRSILLGDMKSILLPDDVFTIHCHLERAPQEVNYIKEYIAESVMDIENLEFTWDIKNWSKIDAYSRVYKDARFNEECAALFRISILKSDDFANNLIVELRKLHPESETFLTCSISILDAKGCEILTRITHHHFKHGFDVFCWYLLYREEIQHSYLSDDTLRLRCILNMDTGKTTCKITQTIRASPNDEEQVKYNKNELSEDFLNMYLKGDFCDVKIRAGGREVNCHKAILCARSPVISNLLDKADQTSEGCVVLDIEDLDGDTLEQMIYFLYSDKINDLKYTQALELLVASHRYQIRYLTEKCSYI